MHHIPELLLPAGSLEKMRAAFDYGADAVYAGQPRYCLRARNNTFQAEQLQQGIAEAHARGKRFFVTSNLLAHNDKLRTYMRDIEPVIAMRPDALIMADPGLIMLVRERWPHMPIHLSVQANTLNYAAVQFWQKMGVARIILSRELDLDEIGKIRQECPDVQLEVFVHGALCIAYSGRCLLSGYFNHRDANQGTCTNACRWRYAVRPAAENDDDGGDGGDGGDGSDGDKGACEHTQRHALAQQGWALEEEKRPGQFMPIVEDAHGTYIMNSKDLRAVQHVGRLMRIGVDALKIEGRTKSLYYVSRTAQVYRRAIDDAAAGRPFDAALMHALEGLSNRGYTSGFLQRERAQERQNYESGSSQNRRSQFVGQVGRGAAREGWLQVEVKNRFAVGDHLEVIHPSGVHTMVLGAMQDAQGQPLQVAAGSPLSVWLPLEARFAGALLARLLQEPEEMAGVPAGG